MTRRHVRKKVEDVWPYQVDLEQAWVGMESHHYETRKKIMIKKRVRPGMPDTVLPTNLLASERSTPKPELSDYIVWIHGMPGIGKTTLTSMFPDTHHFMFEKGAEDLAVYQVLVPSWQTFRKMIPQFAASHFKTAAIDVLELAWDMCTEHILRDRGLDEVPDDDYGKTLAAIRKEMLSVMRRLWNIPGKGTVLVSHSVYGTRKTPDGDEIEDVHPNMSGKPLAMMVGAVDILGYYCIKRGKRTLIIRPSDSIMAKCRLKRHFRWEDGSPIDAIPMGDSEEEAHANFVAAFENRLPRQPVEEKKLFRRRSRI